jgi:hypothetical protein
VEIRDGLTKLLQAWRFGVVADGVEDVFADAPGRRRIVLSDEFPDVGDINSSARV